MKRTFILVLLISTFLFACSSPPATPSAAIVQTAIAQTQAINPTSTLSISPTAEPTHPSILQATPDFPVRFNVATLIADLKPLFSIAHVLGLARLENGHLLVTIEVPGGVQGTYYAVVGNKKFDCRILVEYPDHIYCNGISPKPDQYVNVILFEQGNKEAVFEAQIGIPP